VSTQLQLRRAQPSETRATKQWVAANHYLQCAPPGFGFILEFYERGTLIGAHIWGRPQANVMYNPDYVLQLYRVFFVDETQRCVESQALGMARKHIRTWTPGIRLVLSYSDPSVGHEGTIYDADGWCPLGPTKERHDYGFQTHKGRARTVKDISAKLRWVRTP
jgi:hypothetical protein